MQNRFTHLYQSITAASAIIVIIVLIGAFCRESESEWHDVQRQNKKLGAEVVSDEHQRDALASQSFSIQQIILDDLNRTDRCQTCHLNVTNPLFMDQPLPYRTHSGTYLRDHPMDEFGCTICHGGQGQAVDKKNAHARTLEAQWAHPLLSMSHIQSSCGQCHLTIFSDSMSLDGTAIFQQGQTIFSHEGCLGCHKARGVGGSVGPDLTEQGEKTRHEYSFTNVAGDHTISNWLNEHFKDPEMVSPGSNMLALQLNDVDLHALVTFTMGMNKPNIPFEYFSIETLNEFKGQREQLDGKTIYSMMCSACHGKNGEGKDYKIFKTGVASIGNQDFLSVASKDFIQFTLRNGRGLRQMAAWTPRFSGLKITELAVTADFIKARRIVNSSRDQVQSFSGSNLRGKILYEQNCLMCHGDDGRAAQVISISNPDFLAAATNEFLYQTIRNGRENTAMPGWGRFSSQEIADLFAFLRTWQKTPPRRGVFDASHGDAKNGEQLFHYRCSRCHGTYGQGNSAPAIINKDFLSAASDFFLAEMITKGRHGTAMFGWQQDVATKDKLSQPHVADIICFLRQSADKQREILYPGTTLGQASIGEMLFDKNCSECHGQSGEGKYAPALNNQELLNAGTNGYLYATISLGRHNTKMPSWGQGDENHAKLSIQERHNLVAFLRQWQNVVITNAK